MSADARRAFAPPANTRRVDMRPVCAGCLGRMTAVDTLGWACRLCAAGRLQADANAVDVVARIQRRCARRLWIVAAVAFTAGAWVVAIGGRFMP